MVKYFGKPAWNGKSTILKPSESPGRRLWARAVKIWECASGSGEVNTSNKWEWNRGFYPPLMLLRHKGRFLLGGEIWLPILAFGNTVLILKVGHPEVIIAHLYFSMSCLAVWSGFWKWFSFYSYLMLQPSRHHKGFCLPFMHVRAFWLFFPCRFAGLEMVGIWIELRGNFSSPF